MNGMDVLIESITILCIFISWYVRTLHGLLIKELEGLHFLKLSPIWSSSFLFFLSLCSDFALTKVIWSSGNGSIMSSDLLVKCLPWILRAIQSNLGLTFANWRLKLHIFMVLGGYPGKVILKYNHYR